MRLRHMVGKVKQIVKRFFSISLKDSFYVATGKKLCLHWYWPTNNFGDAISPIIFRKLMDKNVANSYKVINFLHKPEYFFMGSILGDEKMKNAIICGAGFIKEDSKIFGKPQKILAVRGPLSRNIFKKNGIDCPEIYCDPGLILPFIYEKNCKIEKEWDVGIIAHYVDKEKLQKLKIVSYDLKYTFIDIQGKFETVIDQICKSKYIFSSSLHGIITAHAYGVPATWIKLSDKVIGNGFKFRDYFLSVGATVIIPYEINKIIDLKKGISLSKWYDPHVNQDALMKQLDKIKNNI